VHNSTTSRVHDHLAVGARQGGLGRRADRAPGPARSPTWSRSANGSGRCSTSARRRKAGTHRCSRYPRRKQFCLVTFRWLRENYDSGGVRVGTLSLEVARYGGTCIELRARFPWR
jgi:hypothetical protein